MDDFCLVSVPQSNEFGFREIVDLPFLFLQDVLAAMFLEAPDATLRYSEELCTEAWLTHPLRRAAAPGECVIPYGLFSDAACWKGKGVGTRDSIQPTSQFLGDLIE